MRVIVVLLLCVSLTTNESWSTDTNNDDDAVPESGKPLIVRSVDKHPNLPKETQMAQCTVQSGDTKASAQATFSKKLEGFCSTDDMKMLRETLLDVESRLYRDIYNLQQMIQSMLPPNARTYYFRPPPPPPASQGESRNEYHSNRREQEATTTSTTTTPRTEPQVKTPTVINACKLKSLDTAGKKHPKKEEKPAEPPTTESVKTKNEYTYYWKLDQFPKVFQNARQHEIFSHVFNVKGLFLRIRAHLNYLESESLLLDIEHLANVENAEKMEIEISDGLVFKEIAEEKLFQYSFAILNQKNPNHDIISPVYWNNEDENFQIPNSVHLLSSYVKDHSILVKLTISF